MHFALNFLLLQIMLFVRSSFVYLFIYILGFLNLCSFDSKPRQIRRISGCILRVNNGGQKTPKDNDETPLTALSLFLRALARGNSENLAKIRGW